MYLTTVQKRRCMLAVYLRKDGRLFMRREMALSSASLRMSGLFSNMRTIVVGTCSCRYRTRLRD